MEFIKVSEEKDYLKADELFNLLVKYESDFDNVINGDVVINGFNKEISKGEDSFVYYVKDNDEFIGYIYAYLKTKKNKVITTNIIDLEALFIKKEYRDKGVGKKLINLLEEWAKLRYDDYAIEITCLSNNKNALGFYKSLGYKEVKTILRK